MNILQRFFFILGIPSSIICLFYGFWLFMYGIMTYPIVMMVYGFCFWIFVCVKFPKSGIRRR